MREKVVLTIKEIALNTNELNELGEQTENTFSESKRDGSGAETSASVAPTDSGATESAERTKAKRVRKPKAKNIANATAQASQSPIVSRSRHLSRLKPVEMGVMLLISLLNACQIIGRSLDPERVRLYREMLDIQFPPNIIIIKDRDGNYYIASGHHRVAALLAEGYLEVKCDVYEGTVEDAVIIGGEENQGPAHMNKAAQKAHLKTLLSLKGGPEYSISELVAMTGLTRQTIAKYREERNAGGDFIAVASNMKQDKSPEEQLYDAAKGVVKNIKNHGVRVMAKALEMMQPHLREELRAMIAPKTDA